MRTIPNIDAEEIRPTPEAVLGHLGGGSPHEASARVIEMVGQALEIFVNEAAPAGLFMDLMPIEFEQIYRGDGENTPRTPLAGIFPRAERLALFAVTVGPRVSDRIQALFDAGDFALGAVLDAVASEGTEQTGFALERCYLAALGQVPAHLRLLRYSPGYCGWHISGQRALFKALDPEEIGITLSPSCLMTPLKSISGVMVGGPGEIHDFVADYPFCVTCTDKGCRARIRRVRG